MSIPQSFIQELLSRVDIAEVVGRHVTLRKGGVNLMGLCPFHSEKSPSFSVSPAKQFYHCFGCGKNGNAIGFLMEHLGLGFVDAVRDLAQGAGLTVPEEDLPPEERARAGARKRQQVQLGELLEKAASAYAQQLRQSTVAIDYLKRRGLSGQIAKTFGLGFAPAGWRFLSTVFPDYQAAELAEAGLVIDHDGSTAPETSLREPGTPERHDTSTSGERRRRYDRFRERIMFPIRNLKGECIGFGGRVLDHGEPKYLNSPETPVFSKGQELYGLFEARAAIHQQGHALVTEGYMDVVALHQWGFGQAVATLGTACTADHVRKLFRFTDHVVFSFDGDAAGRRAARKAMEAALPWATDARSVRFLFLPSEHDPDSFVRSEGADAFAQAIRQAQPLSRFLVEHAAQDCDLDSAEGRARMASQAQPLWSQLPDGTLKRQILGELAERIGLDSRDLSQLWQPPSTGGQRRGTTRADRRPPGNALEPSPATSTHQERGNAHAPPPSARPHAPLNGSPSWTERRSRTRPIPRPGGLPGRSEKIARIVLTTPDAHDWLSEDDLQLLARQPAPFGTLFAWIEGFWHDHGPQSWAVIREALRGHAIEDLALGLYHGSLDLGSTLPVEPSLASPSDLRQELRELLRRLHIEHLKQLETDLLSRLGQDPDASLRYRELQLRRRQLEQTDTEH